ncbi:hypothetical protein D9M71_632650 [compost metagenome]
MQVGNHEEGAEKRNGLDDFGRLHTHRFEQRLQQVRERGLTDPAQAQRGKCDTQLAG